MLHKESCVLLVEDDPRVLRLEQRVLEKDGFSVGGECRGGSGDVGGDNSVADSPGRWAAWDRRIYGLLLNSGVLSSIHHHGYRQGFQ